MDRSRALNALAEAADLTRMVEELMNPAQDDKLSQTVGGIRITLRNLRESIINAHDVLTRELVQAARARAAAGAATDDASRSMSVHRSSEIDGMTTRSVLLDNTISAGTNSRRDLRTSVDKALS